MRIRSIKPEFWRSSDVEGMSWDTRLVFIGLWSYVDDNGVGVYKISSIVADLFANDFSLDPNETLRRVNESLNVLETGGQIERYSSDSRHYIYITNWESHQRVPNPNKPRYPLPTCGNVDPNETLISSLLDPNETLRTGAVEQWSSGAVEEKTSATATPKRVKHTYPDDFLMFWEHYPKKVGKDAALKAWKAAKQRASVEDIITGAKVYAADQTRDPKFTKDPQGWLTAGKWADQPEAPRVDPYKQFRMLG